MLTGSQLSIPYRNQNSRVHTVRSHISIVFVTSVFSFVCTPALLVVLINSAANADTANYGCDADS